MDLQKIKQRDRWTCKRCGHKYANLEVVCLGTKEIEDNMLTLCKSCLDWVFSDEEAAIPQLKKLLMKSKVVLVGDCHGNFDRLEQILTEEEPFDFFISVGDFASLHDTALVKLHEVVDKWGDRGYFVRGNHDEVECLQPLSLHQEIRGLTIVGLNGIIKSRNFLKDTPNNISFREIMYASHLRDVDILVTHQPPTGVVNGMGEPVLEELLNYMVPRIYVFGHIHRYKLKFHLDTFVISLPLVTKGHAVAYFRGKDLINLEIVLKRGRKFIRV